MDRIVNHIPLYFILLFTLSVRIGTAQPQAMNADSLRQLVLEVKDSREKAEHLVQLARLFQAGEIDSLGKYSELAFNLATSLKYSKAIAESALFKARFMVRTNNNKDGLIYYKMALNIADSLGETKIAARAALLLGSTVSSMSELDDAIKYYFIGLERFSAIADTPGIVAAYNNIGNIFFVKAAYDSAAYYYDKGIGFSEQSESKPYLANLYYSLSDMYIELGQNENAKKYSLIARAMHEQGSNSKWLALTLNQLGIIEYKLKNIETAIDYYDQALLLYREIGDSLHVNDVRNNLGLIYNDQGNYTTAVKYYSAALKGYQELDFKKGIIAVMGNIGAILQKTGKYTEAIVQQEKVLKMASEYGFRDYRQDALKSIAENYEELGNYHKAFEYQSKFYALNDSIFNLEKEELINDLKFKYEKEKDEALILALENENLEKDLVLKQKTLQRNALLYAGITIMALAVFLFLYFRQRRMKDRIIAEQKIQRLEEEKKLMAAKLLVEGQENERKRIATELHDGLGVLLSATKMQFSTIADQSPGNKDLIIKALKMLEQASGDVRKISHNMMPGLLTKLGFYEAVEDLFEHVDDAGKLSATCEINGDRTRLAENREIMLYRIIQEMVNNTIKHAEASNLKLQINILPGMLDIIYADSGKGFDLGKKLDSGSIGLKSIQSRVDFLNGKLLIETKPGEGVKYTLQIPV